MEKQKLTVHGNDQGTNLQYSNKAKVYKSTTTQPGIGVAMVRINNYSIDPIGYKNK